MAKQIEFKKFLIIECTDLEIHNACGGPGICDNCNDSSMTGYYIAVLNRWLCPECFERWKRYAKWYPEDAEIENKNFNFYAPRLGIKI